MSEINDENLSDKMSEEEEEAYDEPMSLADHQILLYSARRIVKKARKYAGKKVVHIRRPELKKVADGDKVVLVPRKEGKLIKVIKLPMKVAPPKSTLTESKFPAIPQPPPASVPTKMVGVPGKIVSLTIGDRKILVRPIVAPKSILNLETDVGMPETSLRTSSEGSKESQEQLRQKVVNDEVPKAAFQPKILKPQTVGPKIPLRGVRVSRILKASYPPAPRVLARGKIMKRKLPKQFEDEENQECTKKLNPDDFPKAIVYPDVKKEKPPMKIQSVMSTSPFTFSHVFEEAAMQPVQITKTTKDVRRVQPVKNIAPEYKSTEKTSKKRNRKQQIKTIEVPEEVKVQQAVESELNEDPSDKHEDEPEEQFIAMIEGDDIEMLEESNENEKSDQQPSTSVDKIKRVNPSSNEDRQPHNISFPNDFAIMRTRFSKNIFSKAQLASGRVKNNQNGVKLTGESSSSHQPTSVKPKLLNPFVNTATRSQVPKNSLSMQKSHWKPAEKISPPSSSPISIEEVSDDDQFEAIATNSSNLKPSIEIDFDMPPRPEINNQLIETLSNYRVIARYLMLKKKIPPFNFDGLETEYLNVYKTLKK